MHAQLPRVILGTLAVFLTAVVISTATDGTASDIGFLVYAAALVLLALLAATWLVLRRGATRR